MMDDSFTIEYDEYKGDFDLELTMNSGQTSQPPWIKKNDKYYEVLSISDVDVLVEISQDALNSTLDVKYFADDDVNPHLIKDKIKYIFDLDYDVTQVYDYLNKMPELNDVYEFNKGLRLFKAQYPYECIISSICSANNSIKRWTKSIRDIKEHNGKITKFNDEKYYTFPTEHEFLEITSNQLKEYGVGYRDKYMINSTNMILEKEDFHKNIQELSYEEAFKNIMELEGVGPKVADCILLYGYNKHDAYPVDVWINRITSYLYFPNQKVTNKQIMNFAQEKFGEYSGYIQLYLFNFARLSGLMDKLKKQK